MGWSDLYRPHNKPLSDALRAELNQHDSGDPNAGIQDIAILNRTTAYAAYRHKGPGGLCFALVILLRYYRDNTLAYKIVDEFQGPNEDACPERILNLLTPLDDRDDPHDYARAWRERCRTKITQRARAKTVKPGDIIRFEQPQQVTNGEVLDTFVTKRRRQGSQLTLHALRDITRHGSDALSTRHPYRIRNWRTLPFERLTPAQARELLDSRAHARVETDSGDL